MRKAKNFLTIVLSLLIITTMVCGIPFSTFAAVTNNNSVGATSGTTGDCQWEIEGTVLTIFGSGKMGPCYYNDTPWVNMGITEVVISEGVTEISQNAFSGCKSIVSISIPDSVTNIGDKAFSKCDSLAEIVIDPENQVYDSRNNCNAVIRTQYNQLITGCKNSVIPENIERIEQEAFRDCHNLTSITIPPSVTEIGSEVFRGCTKLESISIPDSITRIPDGMFMDCASLNNVTIPDNVWMIGSFAFRNCTGLTSITIPAAVDMFDHDVFSGCTSLKSMTVDENNPYYDSRDNCNGIISTDSNTLIAGCKETVIPDSVTRIGQDAFMDCKSLKSITIPDSVTYIGWDAFNGCTGLENVLISDSVTELGYDAFYNCSSLTAIRIPKGVSKLYPNVFIGCTNLSVIEVDGNNTVYDSRDNCNAIINTQTNQLIVGCKNTIIPDSVVEIGGDAFYGCTALTAITVPHGVTKIGSRAFYDCTNLKSIAIDESVTSIENYAFYNCDKLSDIYYNGTESQWNSIGIKANNQSLSNASRHYNNDNSSITWDVNGSAFSGAGDSTSTHLHDNVRLTDYPDVNMNGHSDFVIYREEWRNNRIELALYNTTTSQPLVYQSGWTLGFSNTSLYRDDEKYYLDTENNRWVKFENGYSYASNHCTGVFVSSRDVVSSGSGTLVLKGLWSNGIPANAVEHNGHYYVFYDESVSWSQAKAKCEESGGHLVTVNSAEEQTFLINLTNKSTKKNMWIGAYPENGVFRWVTNEDFSYTNWASGEPNNVFNMQNAAMMYTKNASYAAGTWNDENENGRDWSGYELSNFGYICEWDEIGLYGLENTYSFENYTETIPISFGKKLFPESVSILSDFVDQLKVRNAVPGQNGLCFGMVVTAMATSIYNSPKASSYVFAGKSANCLFDVRPLYFSADTKISAKDYIRYGQYFLISTDVQVEEDNNTIKTDIQAETVYANKFKKMYEAIRSNNEPVCVGIKCDAGAHALWALRIKKETDSNIEISVYDCNYPGKERILTLHKQNSKIISWEYPFDDHDIWSSDRTDSAITYCTPAKKFIERFNNNNQRISDDYQYLVFSSDNNSVFNDSRGNILNRGIESAIKIEFYGNKSSKGDGQYYWMNFDDSLNILSDDNAASYCMATNTSVVKVSIPQKSSAEINVESEDINAVDLVLSDDRLFAVTFDSANIAGEYSSVALSGKGTGNVSTEQADEGIIVNGAESISVIHDEAVYEDTVYQLNGEKNSLIQNNDGVPVVLEDSNNDGVYDTEVEPKLIGDTNLDGKVDIRDITAIQRHLAELETMTDEQVLVADTNLDSELDISDATWGQMYIAKCFESFLKPYSESEPEEEDEEKYLYFKNSDSWTDVKAHMWSDESEKDLVGTEMEQIEDDVYRVVVPDDAMWIQFSGNNGTAQTEEMQIIDYGLIFEDDSWKEYLYSSNN